MGEGVSQANEPIGERVIVGGVCVGRGGGKV